MDYGKFLKGLRCMVKCLLDRLYLKKNPTKSIMAFEVLGLMKKLWSQTGFSTKH